MKDLVKHAGREIGAEFTPTYNPSMSLAKRVQKLYTDAKNKKSELVKEPKGKMFQGKAITFAKKVPNSPPILMKPTDILSDQDAVKKTIPVILASSEIFQVGEILANPSPDASELIISAGADRREEMMSTLSRLIPDTTQLELANMISSEGKKAAIDLTMAKMSSGNEPPKTLKSPISDVLSSGAGIEVPREKIAYQALGIRPGRKANIDSKFKMDLRNKITEIVGLSGTTGKSKGRVGQLPFIDNHTFITKEHINDFRDMLGLYHYIRANNAPYMEMLVSGLKGAQNPSLLPVGKMIDYLMPTPDHLFRGEPVIFIAPDLGKIQTKKMSRIYKLVFGIKQQTAAAISEDRQANAKDAQKLVALYENNRENLARDLNAAVSLLAALDLDDIQWKNYSESGGLPPNSEQIFTDATFQSVFDRNGHFNERLHIPLYLIAGRQIHHSPQEQFEKLRKLVGRIKKKPDKKKFNKKLKEILKGTPQGVVMVQQNGFTLPPIGWSRAWMIPTMMVIDEYWAMLADESAEIQIHELLYLIGIKAVEVSGYEIQPQEYLLILLLLGVYETSAKAKNKVNLTLERLDPDNADSYLGKHLKALKKLNGKVELKDLSKDKEIRESVVKELAKGDKKTIDELTRLIEAADKTNEKGAAVSRRSAGRIGSRLLTMEDKDTTSILPFSKKGRLSPGTKYYDKMFKGKLTKPEEKSIEDWEDKLRNQIDSEMSAIETDIDIIKETMGSMSSLLSNIVKNERAEDAATTAAVMKSSQAGRAAVGALVETALRAQAIKEKYEKVLKENQELEKQLVDYKNKTDKLLLKIINGIAKAIPTYKKIDSVKQAQGITDRVSSAITAAKHQRLSQAISLAMKEAYDAGNKRIEELNTKESKEKAEEKTSLEPIMMKLSDDESTWTKGEIKSAITDWQEALVKNKNLATSKQGDLFNKGDLIIDTPLETDDFDTITDAQLGQLKEYAKALRSIISSKESISKGGLWKVGTIGKLLKMKQVHLETTEELEPAIAISSGDPEKKVDVEEAEPIDVDWEEGDEVFTEIEAETNPPIKIKCKCGAIFEPNMDLPLNEIKCPKCKKGGPFRPNPPFMEVYDIEGKKRTKWFTEDEYKKMHMDRKRRMQKEKRMKKKKKKGGRTKPNPDPATLEDAGAPQVIIDDVKKYESHRMYKEHKIVLLKPGHPRLLAGQNKAYAVPKFKKKFKLLKHAKTFIDSKTDGRKRKILDGYTCVYIVNKRKCGGLLVTNANSQQHKCLDCDAQYEVR